MHEKDKLDEARYFLGHLKELPEPRSFRFELSAFLTAARTALQYAREEAQAKGVRTWYDTHVAGKPLAKFFKDKRDINIHQTPVLPRASAALTVRDGGCISTSVHLVARNPEGQITQEVTVGRSPRAHQPNIVAYSYAFSDWKGPEDVLTLCSKYLAEVESVISDGIAKGHLSG